jgi:zinc D-Ala-D-Ala carboxypeptidase
MKAWAAATALAAVIIASAVGLWVTWDSTRTSATDPLVATAPSTTTTTLGDTADAHTRVTAPAPQCTVGETPVTTDPLDDFGRVVIDTGHSLPAAYTPDDLVSVARAGFPEDDQVREIVIPDLDAMRKAAAAAGSPFVLVSGYRSYSYQAGLFSQRVGEVGEAEAGLRTAKPGHSEHQLGTAIDVTDPSLTDLVPAFAATPAGRWVAAHAWQYGFVVSYPEGAKARTCYEYEPWHLRFVGRFIAGEIHSSGVTPREWMLSHPR